MPNNTTMKLMEQNKNMTAVDWFADKIWSLAIQLIYDEMNEGQFAMAYDELIEQAKQIQKEQIKNAVDYGCSDWGSCKDAEQYYNETYGKQ